MKSPKTLPIIYYPGLLIWFIFPATINTGCQKQIIPSAKTDSSGLTLTKIVYTDLNPDSVIISPSRLLYKLDLDKDGKTDFVFTETASRATACRNNASGTTYSGHVQGASGTNNAIIFDLSMDIARPLDSPSVIDASANWTSVSLPNLFYVVITGPPAQCNSNSGAWFYSTDKYLGLKFIKNGNTYYGWAKLQYGVTVPSLTLKGYAYNSVPNQSIFAGQTK